MSTMITPPDGATLATVSTVLDQPTIDQPLIDQPVGGLVRDAAVGSDRAWSALVAQHRRLLQAVGRRCGLTTDETEDAAQATWVALLTGVGGVRDPDRISGWLACTMRRECLAVLRGRTRTRRLVDRVGRVVADAAPVAEVDHGLLDAEQILRLWRAVAQLPDRQRAVITALAQNPAPSYQQVARQLSMAVGTIGPTRMRALQQLRGLLTEEATEWAA